jgi:hypothetical protein
MFNKVIFVLYARFNFISTFFGGTGSSSQRSKGNAWGDTDAKLSEKLIFPCFLEFQVWYG